MMKILVSLGFVVCCGVFLYTSTKLNSRILSSIKNKRFNYFLTSFVSSLIVLIFFLQYWLLTGIFPKESMILLLSASLLASIIYEVSGSALGMTIEDTKNKIYVLNLVRGFEFGIRYPRTTIAVMALGLIMFIGWIIALIIYWNTPPMTPQSLFWISFNIFIIPQFLGTIIMNQYFVPFLLSEEYDNDLRNQYFITGFNNVLSTTIFIMLPLGLFYNYYSDLSALPPFWFMMLIPLLLFVVLTIIPFLIGTNKFQHQQLYHINWRIDWLNSVSQALVMPDDKSKEKTLQEKLVELDDAIEEQISKYEIFKYIDYSDDEEFRTMLARKRNKNAVVIFDTFKNNKHDIYKWDVRASHLKKLQDLRDNIHIDNSEKCKVFVASNLSSAEKERDKLSKTKSRIAGVIIGGATALIGFLFKSYEDDILKILGNFN